MADVVPRRDLATLIVDGLEIGTGKQDSGAIGEIFGAFGIDLDAIARPLRGKADEKRLIRREAARQLAESAPSLSALVSELLRCGGRYTAMVRDIYARLAKHAVTTGGPRTFRISRDGLDVAGVTISEAFIERIRSLERTVRAVETGTIDEDAVRSFVLWDGGGLYGTWPVDSADGFRLPDALLHLAWLRPALQARAEHEPAWSGPLAVIGAAENAGKALVAAGERLVRAHLANLDRAPVFRLTDVDPQLHEWPQQVATAEPAGRPGQRVLVATATPEHLHGVNEPSDIGLDEHLDAVVLPGSGRGRQSNLEELAGFIAMWRLGHWPTARRADLELRLFATPDTLATWLNQLRTACDEASEWLQRRVFRKTGSMSVEVLHRAVQEYLNLPLWQNRSLLYEVWVLCATLDAAEHAGWIVELPGLLQDGDVWRLSEGRTDRPVGMLRHGATPAAHLEVWREPARVAGGVELTPDVAVSTPGDHRRDLLVVEAKDQYEMRLGRVRPLSDGMPDPNDKTPIGVALRYANGLRPRATWVCNHCDIKPRQQPEVNRGDFWTRMHLAGQFRPGNVPPEFGASVSWALSPGAAEHRVAAPPEPRGLVLVIDVTASMHTYLTSALARLGAAEWSSFDQIRAVLYSDHGYPEPFLVRKFGPAPTMAALLEAVAVAPSGHGGDVEEALEDAMQRCRELVDDLGPQVILVLTDAPAHTVDRCPYGIDVQVETRALLRAGCRVYVASDHQPARDATWAAFAGHPGFRKAPLSEFIGREGARG
ncbi:hypothetical protein ABZ388_11915 [Micromonospora parva]|uniref:hypothetical protein n=1 Tax=Micromonospora parva TaxID=1464048 RepID=UPI0033DE051E